MAKSAFVYDISLQDFETRVIDASHEVPVLVDFWAPWCGPCRTLGPMLEKLAEEYGGRFLLAKVNADEEQALAAQFRVRSIPSVKAVINGQLVDEFTGAQPEPALRAFIDRLLPSPIESLRAEAREARARGELEMAAALLAQALGHEPENEALRLDLVEVLIDQDALEDARPLLDGRATPTQDEARVAQLEERLALLSQAPQDAGEVATLAARVQAEPADLSVRLAYAQALVGARRFDEAFAQLLEVVRRDRSFEDDAGRKTMVQLFGTVNDDGLVRRYRSELAATLNGF
ncbi:tetratricopeptide repeat protein [Niveibacterium sp. SC-1]|uniref:tetratricopeptide repeat protein n=1 Tax=Niveibacterium sp. SC-1 TaxID=3135646 RepID=UPI00311FB22B